MSKIDPENGAAASLVAESIPRGETALARPPEPVHRGAVSRSRGRRRWSWSKKKREAFKLVLQGVPMNEAAKRVGVHRHSVENWAKTPEWHTEMRAALEEAQLTTRLRRMKMTSILADKLGAHSMKALQTEDIDTKRAGLVLREHLDYVKAERELFGEGGHLQPTAPGTALHVYLGQPGHPQVVEKNAEAVAAFRRWFEEGYDPKLAVIPRWPHEVERVLAGHATTNE